MGNKITFEEMFSNWIYNDASNPNSKNIPSNWDEKYGTPFSCIESIIIE